MNNNERSFAEKTSAADKSIGFDYQYYYFLDKLLNLKTGQSVGLEIKDDVHTDLNANFQLLFQLKHTTQLSATGKPLNLTELDDDLLKTLSNWSKVITDKTQGREDELSQNLFLNRTEFHLVTNKSRSAGNKFFAKILEVQREICTHLELKAYLKTLEGKTSSGTIKNYIRDILALTDNVQKQFFRKIQFELEVDDITSRVRRSIEEKAIDKDHVDLVFARLDSNIREDNFIAIKNGETIHITYENFMEKYRRVFIDARNKKLPFYPFVPDIPDDIFSQNFVKQLLHIGDICNEDVERIIEYTTYKLQLARYLILWEQAGELVADEVDAFHAEVFLRWENEFRSAFRKCKNEDEIIDSALALLTALRKERFALADENLPTALCNGELYLLSDTPQIGWHQEWDKL